MARPKKIREEEVIEKQPEIIADGVVREVGENPIEDNPVERKPRLEGNWVKVTHAELVALESSGKLFGYDPSTGEALVK